MFVKLPNSSGFKVLISATEFDDPIQTAEEVYTNDQSESNEIIVLVAGNYYLIHLSGENHLEFALTISNETGDKFDGVLKSDGTIEVDRRYFFKKVGLDWIYQHQHLPTGGLQFNAHGVYYYTDQGAGGAAIEYDYGAETVYKLTSFYGQYQVKVAPGSETPTPGDYPAITVTERPYHWKSSTLAGTYVFQGLPADSENDRDIGWKQYTYYNATEDKTYTFRESVEITGVVGWQLEYKGDIYYHSGALLKEDTTFQTLDLQKSLILVYDKLISIIEDVIQFPDNYSTDGSL